MFEATLKIRQTRADIPVRWDKPKACVRIEVYKKLLWRATTKCGEQLKCGEQKYIEDIILVRWQHHF